MKAHSGTLRCLAVFCVLAGAQQLGAAEVIGEEALFPYNDRIEYSELIGFAPGNDEVVRLNPPRFRWFYAPTMPELAYSWFSLYDFRLQIAYDPEFRDTVVDVRTDINFYNALAPLGLGKHYWRVGYTN